MTTVTKPLPRIRNPEKKILRPLTPKDLIPRIGASEAMIRIFLRKYYPDIHEKNKSWIFSPETAREIETDYKSRVQAREADKKQRIERELAGVDE